VISDISEGLICPLCNGRKFVRVSRLKVKGELLWIVRCVKCGYERVVSYELDLKVG